MHPAPEVPRPELAKLSLSARALYQPGMKRRQFATRLVEAGLLEDAAIFFGSLVPCHAVWWACLCLWKMLSGRLSPAQRAHFTVAARWAADTSEEHRKAAEVLLPTLDYADPVSWLLLAAARSGSSPSADQHPTPLNLDVVADAAEAAVRLAVANLPHDERDSALRHAIRLGLDISAGGCPRLVLVPGHARA
jgi:hypothetical protein